jgi:glycosyltransferase involved in cell wall biosynthesis
MSATAAIRHICAKLGLPASRFLAEKIALARIPVLRNIARALMPGTLRDIDAWLDRDFYLRQLVLPGSYSAAMRDPSLHYAMVGHWRSYWPRPDFDPIFYRAQNPDLGWASDPLGHRVRKGLPPDAPTNEVATLAPLAGVPGAANTGVILTLHHGRGGGSSRFLQLYEEALARQGHRVVRLMRVSTDRPLFQPYDRTSGLTIGPCFHLFDDRAQFIALCRTLDARRLVVNHVIDLKSSALSLIPELCRDAAMKFEVILHDYFLICARINMVKDGRYCGGPPDTPCCACMTRGVSARERIDPVKWRKVAENFVRQADRLLAPSWDAASRLSSFWSGLPVSVWQPEEDAKLDLPLAPALSPDEPLRVAVIGALNVAKGFDVLRKLAKRARRRRAPLRFLLLGHSIDDAALRRHGVQIYGRYRDADIDTIVRTVAPHIAFQPAIWPETWSFVASIALRQRIPFYTFDIGAVPERLRRLGSDTVLPLALAERPDDLLDRLLSIRSQAIEACHRHGGTARGDAPSVLAELKSLREPRQ